MGANNTKHTKHKENINKKDAKKSGNKHKSKSNIMLIKCTYNIKHKNEIQIINNTALNEVNEEIEQKIKILNGKKKEKLIFKKKFNKLGLNTITFICEEKLNNMNFMFNNCTELRRVEFISFDTSHVTLMEALFELCKELEYIDVTNFNTSNVTSMSCMFNKCYKLKEIKGINSFSTPELTYTELMFNECNELEFLDLSKFNIANITDMSFMFNKCYKLKEIKGINNFDIDYIKNNEIITDHMFDECNQLKNCDKLISALKNRQPTTEYLNDLEEIADNVLNSLLVGEDNNSSNINNDNIQIDQNQMQIICTYDIKDNNEIQIINNKDKDDVNEEIEQKIKILNGEKKDKLIFKKKFNILGLNTITFICERKLKNMNFMFYKCSSLKQVEFISFDTSEVTSMEAIFQSCEELVSKFYKF